MKPHHYSITGMHCGACAAKITKALEGLDAVSRAEVTRNPDAVAVHSGAPVPLDALNAAVGARGDYRLHAQAATPAPAASSATPAPPASSDDPPESLYPLLLIVAYLTGAVLLIAWTTGQWSPMTLMRHFMAGFFIVFSFFKMLDIRGFVSAFRGYDLVARRSETFAYAYPFIELALGVAYLVSFQPVLTNAVTLVVMAVGAAGVGRALLDRRAIRCACLGTALNLPMTKVTLIEDLTMAVMAAAMLLMPAS